MNDIQRKTTICFCGGSFINLSSKKLHLKSKKHLQHLTLYNMEDEVLPGKNYKNPKEKIDCECGSHFYKNNRTNHEKGKKHVKFLNEKKNNQYC